jgi:hypothetical protein
VEFVGANLDRQQLHALFAADGAQPLHERLAALSARAVNVPELTAEWSSTEGRQTVSVRDLSLQNVVAGKAARVSASEVTSEGAFIASVAIGSLGLTDLNFAMAARIYADGAGPVTKTPMQSRARLISLRSACAPEKGRPCTRIDSR